MLFFNEAAIRDYQDSHWEVKIFLQKVETYLIHILSTRRKHISEKVQVGKEEIRA